MQIELSNGLNHVWQWDPKITITVVTPEDAQSVHFRWGNRAVELPLDDHRVDIPPELMQQPHPIRLWAYKPNHTMDVADIQVYPKQKPSDYAYTPTEIRTWEQLDERITALEQGGGVAGVSSVNGKTGTVELTAEDVGAASPEDVTSAVESAAENLQPKGDYITQDKLQSATDAALEQAKASGEFDGAKGDTGPQGPPGDDGSPGVDGKSINWRGEFSTSTQYSRLDAVSYEGSSYIFANDTPITGAVPGIDAEWELMAKGGSESDNITLVTITGDVTFTSNATYQEIVEAYNAGEIVHALLKKTAQLFNLSSISDSSANFVCLDRSEINRELVIRNDGKVNLNTKYLQIRNLTQEITSESTNDKYPSAKAVYDYVHASGINIAGATVGQIAKIAAVDENGVPTEWVPVDMPSGGESGGNKKWTKIIDIEIAETTNRFTVDTINGITEIHIRWGELKNSSSINSELVLAINGKNVCHNAVPIVSTGGTLLHGWSDIKYNGLCWNITRSSGAIYTDNISVAAPQSPYNLIYDVGAANRVDLYVELEQYAPISGTLEVWAR